MRSLPAILLAVPLAMAAVPPTAARLAAQDRCDVRRELDGRLDGTTLSGVLVAAASGTLEVVGIAEAEVRVRGVVCASREGLADDARLVVETRRGAAWIEAALPEAGGWRNDYVRMDLVVEMPRSLAADIVDGSGDLTVRAVAAVRVEDGSGGIRVEDVPGPVEIDDRSGEIDLAEVGSVELDDGSGGVVIRGVSGDVHVLADGSGTLVIEDVAGSVRIDEDGSGSIAVERVGGDFVLERDGSGTVRYRDVKGTVRIPGGG